MSTSIQLRHASPEVQQILQGLDDEDSEVVSGFLQKVLDYRAMVQRGEYAAAGRYYDGLVGEIERLRVRYSDLKNLTGGIAAAGAAAGAWLFGVGALAGGLAGGALGYVAAKGRKERMLKLCDALLIELGPRPG